MPQESSDDFGLGDDAVWLDRLRGARTDVSKPSKSDSYEILEEFARGGQGVVYRARQQGTNRMVALKMLSDRALASPAGQQRFIREIKTASALDHPNVVTIYGSEIVDDKMTLAMQWIDGTPIDRWVAEPARKSQSDILKAFLKVCDAVRHAHQRGIIHRDLKPSNILVDRQSEPYVLDFGLAKILDDAAGDTPYLTLTEDFVGTPAFAAPEQIDQAIGAIDVRTDIYALGIILFNLITGQLPFETKQSLPDLFDDIRQGRWSATSSSSLKDNREVDAIVLKCIQTEPDQRYSSVEALIADIERYLRGDAVLAHPPSRIYRIKKLVRRHKLLTAFIALLAVSAIVSTTLSVVALEQQALAEKNAEEATKQLDRMLAINEFLKDMLSSAAPQQTLGRELSVRQMLDEAAARIDAGSLKQRPFIEASVCSTIGQTYMELGLYDRAELYMNRAYDTHLKIGVENSADALRAFNDLGELDFRRGNFKSAERRFRQTIANLESLPHSNDVDIAQAKNSLALVFHNTNRNPEAITLFREALENFDGATGNQLIDRILILDNLANAYAAMGKIDDAIRESANAIRFAEENLSPLDPRLLSMRHNYAFFLRGRGELDKFVSLMNSVYELRQQIYEPSHPMILKTKNALASAYYDMGRFEKAIPLFREVLEDSRAVLGPSHPDLALYANNLANTLVMRGQLEEATPLYEEALRIRKKTLAANDPELAGVHYDLGWHYVDLANYETAISHFDTSVRIWRDQNPPRPVDLANGLAGFGNALTSASQYDRAEKALRECRDLRSQHLPDTWQLSSAEAELGQLLAATGRIAEGLAMLEGALAGMKRAGDTPPPIVERTQKRITAWSAAQASNQTTQSKD